MPQRDVTVRLGLNAAPYVAGVKQAQVATGKLSADITRTSAGGSKSAAVLGSSFGLVGLAVGGVAAKMISAAADFEQGMSNVKATGADAAKNIGKLREAALQAGAATKYSATEAAGGVEALAKAGVDSADILGGGLKGALSLAAAGNLDVAGSAEAAASAMNQFGLTGKDVPHIADLLAAAAGKAQGEVSDMAQALNQAGLIAHGAGASIEETTGTLAAFASAGLVGSDAGTSFKTMLQRLQAPTAQSKALMDKLGISAYDAKGNFVGLAAVAGQLQKAFKGQSDKARAAALATIFGSDAVRAANVLYKEGTPGIKKWTKAVDDSGFAAKTASTKMDNLSGDIENLKGSLDTLFIKGGGTSQGPLRELTQEVTDFLNAVGDLQAFMDKHPFYKNLIGLTKDLRNPGAIPGQLLKTIGSPNAKKDFLGMADKALQVKMEADITDLTKKGVLANQIVNGVVQKKPSKLDGDPKPAVKAAKTADSAINGVHQRKVPKIDADASAAIRAAKSAQQAINNVLGGLAKIGGGHAMGGAITGPGTGTSDSIPARLSNGEHVLTASDVQKAGGQDAVYRLRAGIQSGGLKFAAGGAVASPSAPAMPYQPVVSSMVTTGGPRPIYMDDTLFGWMEDIADGRTVVQLNKAVRQSVIFG